MATKEVIKRADNPQSKAASPASTIAIEDLPNEVLPMILGKLPGLKLLDCMYLLNKKFYDASVEALEQTSFTAELGPSWLAAAVHRGSLRALRILWEKEDVKEFLTGNQDFQPNLLVYAAAIGNVPCCRFLLEALPACINDQDEGVRGAWMHTMRVDEAFYTTLEDMHEELAALFLDHGAELDETVLEMLRNAVCDNDVKLVEFLLGLKKGTQAFDVDEFYYWDNAKHYSLQMWSTHLKRAVRLGHAAMVQCLLDHGADLNAYQNHGITVHATQQDVIRILLSKNADLSHYTNQLLYLAVKTDSKPLAEEALVLFTKIGATIDTPSSDSSGRAALHDATRIGSPSMVKFLLDNGAKVNLLDGDGCSPLLTARQRVSDIRLLMERGADVAVVSPTMGSVLHTLCHIGLTSHETNHDILTAALNAGVPVDAQATLTESATALQLAAQNGQISILMHLIEAGANINAQTSPGYTPLHGAVHNEHYSCVEALLDSGAATDIITVDGKLAEELDSAGLMKKYFERVENKKKTFKAQVKLNEERKVTDVLEGLRRIVQAMEIE